MSLGPDTPLDGAMRERLMKSGRQAVEHAYSPHSRLRVGAAVLAKREIYTGCNIENGSYGLTVCAERVAILKAVSEGHRQIEAVFVTGSAPADMTTGARFVPCGACLQVMAEFGGPELLVIVDQAGEFHLRDLLPQPFGV